MLLIVRHFTYMRYSQGAKGLALRLKLFPPSFQGQHVVDWHVNVDGADIGGTIINGYGERFAQWLCPRYRDALGIVAWGRVETQDKAGIVRGLHQPCPPAVFLRDTPLTIADKAIKALGEDLTMDGDSLAGLHALSARVREAIPYHAGITDGTTPAAAALSGAGGVCQDHAHVFIAAARACGVPARYVAGYMLAGNEANQQYETHAWAEAHVGALGWVGFDVTNGLCPTERYVRLCTGLDANDAAPVRGIVAGTGSSAVSADVRIACAQGDFEAIQQQQQQQQQQQ